MTVIGPGLQVAPLVSPEAAIGTPVCRYLLYWNRILTCNIIILSLEAHTSIPYLKSIPIIHSGGLLVVLTV